MTDRKDKAPRIDRKVAVVILLLVILQRTTIIKFVVLANNHQKDPFPGESGRPTGF